jgi:hypothetical protein
VLNGADYLQIFEESLPLDAFHWAAGQLCCNVWIWLG